MPNIIGLDSTIETLPTLQSTTPCLGRDEFTWCVSETNGRSMVWVSQTRIFSFQDTSWVRSTPSCWDRISAWALSVTSMLLPSLLSVPE